MKKLIPALFLFLALFVSSSLVAQSPQGIPYQAVMRNVDGSVMANSAMSLTFMIHDGSATGTVVYQESHSLTSNAQGLVSCIVGNGVVSQGNFSNINWGGGAKFLHVMMGSTDLGTQQMLSVPYALYSENVGVRVSATGDTLVVGGQSVIVPGVSVANPINNTPTSGLGSQVLPGNNLAENEFIPLPGCEDQFFISYYGVEYPVIEINGQCWFAKNLEATKFQNGDDIVEMNDSLTWVSSFSPGYSYQDANLMNKAIYGNLYNWYALIDDRNICPMGWHVPNDAEWMYLESSAGLNISEQQLLNQARGCDANAGGKLKLSGLWNTAYDGYTNELGFSAIPGGYRNSMDANFSGLGVLAAFYTLNSYSNNYVIGRFLDPWFGGPGCISRFGFDSGGGGSVRCVKDDVGMLRGCRNLNACNYNPNANFEDGSCLIAGNRCDDNNSNTYSDVLNSSCECSGVLYSQGTGVYDLDGNFYSSFIINGQEWMQQNLAVTKYRNGDPIPTGLSNNTWQTTTSGAYAIYNNDAANNTLYGKLYNWYAVNDSRGLCPMGWHIPTNEEWSISFGSSSGGGMKANYGWSEPNFGANNETGFTGLGNGYRNFDGVFTSIGQYSGWWTSSEYTPNFAYSKRLLYNDDSLTLTWDYKSSGLSIRCLRD